MESDVRESTGVCEQKRGTQKGILEEAVPLPRP